MSHDKFPALPPSPPTHDAGIFVKSWQVFDSEEAKSHMDAQDARIAELEQEIREKDARISETCTNFNEHAEAWEKDQREKLVLITESIKDFESIVYHGNHGEIISSPEDYILYIDTMQKIARKALERNAEREKGK